jgi:16S rRNA processing protein RimM
MKELLGRIIKIHGHEGAVTVKIENFFSDNIPEMEFVFLQIEGKQVPFFIDHYQISGHENILFWFQDYTSVEKVKEFIGSSVYILSEDYIGKSGSVKEDIIGFELYNASDELIGIVTKVTENPAQWLITVVSDSGKEILIPFHEDLILDKQKGSKRITMTLPEGLRTLN